MADVAYAMLKKDGRTYTGQFEIDEIFLRQEKGVTDMSGYVFQPDTKHPRQLADEELDNDFFIADAVMDEVKRLRASVRPKL